jgi:hypothetical protein
MVWYSMKRKTINPKYIIINNILSDQTLIWLLLWNIVIISNSEFVACILLCVAEWFESMLLLYLEIPPVEQRK